MGGEHVCHGCNALHGMPHRGNCPRVTRARLMAAEPLDFYGAPDGVLVAAHGHRLKVNDADCLPSDGYNPDAVEFEPPEALNWDEALNVARLQAEQALHTDPRNAEVRQAFAQTAQAFATIALVQELRALRAEPTQVILAPDDDGYLDQIVRALRLMPGYGS